MTVSQLVNEERVKRLRDAVSQKRLIIVCGAGVAAASTSLESCWGWRRLVDSGLAYALKVRSDLPSGFEGYVRSDLDLAAALPSALISAAQKIEQALGGPDSADFKAWLRECVGDAPVTEPSLIRAIAGLSCPIATFNYDGLIERVTGFTGRSWREPRELQAALSGMSSDIAHLHGIWTDSSSVVFGSQSYGRALNSDTSQILQKSIASTRSMMFVGSGDGLADPNIGPLFAWLEATFPESSVKHYRLCLSSEYDSLQAEMKAAGNIDLISYGESYDDLAKFLSDLAPSTDQLVVAQNSQALQLDLADRARRESVLSKHISLPEKISLDRILVRPVVLPVSHEQFMESRRNEEAPNLERSDIEADLATSEVLVLVADESSGLTSALQWLASRGAELRHGAHPVVVDYKLFQGGSPLTRSVKLHLRSANISIADDDEIPSCCLAIDNVMPSDRPVFKRLLLELPFPNASITILGCRSGAEAKLLGALADSGISRVATRYLGKLNRNDIEEIAALVEPSAARRIATKAVEILNREHLSRTPLTVCLLISVILQGEALLSTGSETALLDAYVSLLLGQGDPRDDSRYDFDAQDRISLLAALAQEFVQQDRGAIKESDAIAAFEQFFKDVRWKESASAVLGNLTGRHILTVRNQSVSFSQTSFLHLFAAKRALVSKEFRQRLFARPHHYGQIIRHYAALSRSDEELLRRMTSLLQEQQTAVSEIKRGRNLSRLKADELPTPGALEHMLGLLDAEPNRDESSSNALSSPIDPLDEFDDTDYVPFPASQIEEAPPLVRIISTLSLTSVVLRDSEQVLDHDLKRQLLALNLKFWGSFADALEADNQFKAGMEQIAKEIVPSGQDLNEAEQAEFVRHFIELAPILLAFGAIRAHLTSRKLFLSLEDCFADVGFQDDAGSSVLGALLGWDMAEDGWASHLRVLQEKHPDVYAVTTVVRSICLFAYYHTRPAQEDEDALLEFLSDQFSRFRDTSRERAIDIKNYKARQMQRLRANRLKSLARQNGAEPQEVDQSK